MGSGDSVVAVDTVGDIPSSDDDPSDDQRGAEGYAVSGAGAERDAGADGGVFIIFNEISHLPPLPRPYANAVGCWWRWSSRCYTRRYRSWTTEESQKTTCETTRESP